MNRGRLALLTFVRHRGPVVVHSPHRDRDLEFKDKTPSTMLGQHSLIYSANFDHDEHNITFDQIH